MNPAHGILNERGLWKTIIASTVLHFCLLGVAPLPAQTLSGYLNEYAHTAYAGSSSQFRMDDAKLNGVSYLGGTVNLFCADLPGTSIDQDISTYPHYHASFTVGSLNQMTIWSRFSNTQNEALAIAMMRWLVDNYYVSNFLTPANNEHARRYAFQNVIWEVLGDGGTSAGLSFTTGNINRSKFAPGGSAYDATLWTYMSQMLTAVSSAGVTTAYQPVLQVEAALDARSSYQDYLIVPIPEPSAALLAGLAGLLAMGRRRR
jgi:hypothetical protein